MLLLPSSVAEYQEGLHLLLLLEVLTSHCACSPSEPGVKALAGTVEEAAREAAGEAASNASIGPGSATPD